MTKLGPLLPEQQLSPERHAALRSQLHELVEATPRLVRRRHRILVIGAVTAVALGGGGVAVAHQYFGSKPVTNHRTARCYAKLSTDFGSNFPGTTVGGPLTPAKPGGSSRLLPVTAPIDECAQLWKFGVINGRANQPGNHTFPVPHLVGCVLPDGTAAVFPGPDGTCQRLGLATALPG